MWLRKVREEQQIYHSMDVQCMIYIKEMTMPDEIMTLMMNDDIGVYIK